MLQIIKNLLLLIINNIDSGNSNISENLENEIILFLQKLNYNELSKTEAANYLGVCRATFDNYVKKGLIPKGHKRQGFKELSWFKKDLDNYLDN